MTELALFSPKGKGADDPHPRLEKGQGAKPGVEVAATGHTVYLLPSATDEPPRRKLGYRDSLESGAEWTNERECSTKREL